MPEKKSLGPVVLVLRGYVDLRALTPVVMTIWRKNRLRAETKYLLECSQVADFSSYALAVLAQLRYQLRQQRSELVLVNCTDYVKGRMVDPLFLSLLGEEPVPKTRSGPPACVPTMRLPRKTAFYLRGLLTEDYWLN